MFYSGHANGNAFEIEDGKIPSSKNTIKTDLKNFKLGSAINRLLETTFIKYAFLMPILLKFTVN